MADAEQSIGVTVTLTKRDIYRDCATAAAETWKRWGEHPTGVILGWRAYLVLRLSAHEMVRSSECRESMCIMEVHGMRITVDPDSRDRITPVLSPEATATRLAWSSDSPEGARPEVYR